MELWCNRKHGIKKISRDDPIFRGASTDYEKHTTYFLSL